MHIFFFGMAAVENVAYVLLEMQRLDPNRTFANLTRQFSFSALVFSVSSFV
jgi:hypothetical protein